MAKRYHINPDTKEVGVCSAEIRCKFAENGEEPKHYTDPIKAHKDAEDMLENEYGAFSTMSQQDERPISVGTHASHCCETHGCKYGADDCPVARGQIKGVKACEYCDMDEEDRIPPEDFQRDFPAGEPLSEYVNDGDVILYKDEVIEIDNFRYNSAMLAYEIETLNGETVFIPDSDWYEESKIKLFGQNEVMKDPEEFQRTYEAGEPLSSQIAIGDQFSYDGEVYKMKDYEYNRPLLQYEIKTNKGDITISDDDWYWSGNKIKLLEEEDEQ